MFFPLLTPLLPAALSLLLVGQVRLAYAAGSASQDDSGQFIQGDLGQAPNQDSENVPGLAMQMPTYSGNGCPQGSATAVMSADGRTLSVLFDSYVVEAGQHVATTRDSKGCQINIPFLVPPGYSVQVVKMDYRGFTSLPAGSRSTFGAGFRFLEINGRETNSPRVLRATVMQGPKSENFILTSEIRGRSSSPCGQNFVLAAESTLNVQSNRAGEQTLSTVDSLDAIQTPVVYSLRWQHCKGTGSIEAPPPGGPRPGRPGPPPGRPVRPLPPRFR